MNTLVTFFDMDDPVKINLMINLGIEGLEKKIIINCKKGTIITTPLKVAVNRSCNSDDKKTYKSMVFLIVKNLKSLENFDYNILNTYGIKSDVARAIFRKTLILENYKNSGDKKRCLNFLIDFLKKYASNVFGFSDNILIELIKAVSRETYCNIYDYKILKILYESGRIDSICYKGGLLHEEIDKILGPEYAKKRKEREEQEKERKRKQKEKEYREYEETYYGKRHPDEKKRKEYETRRRNEKFKSGPGAGGDREYFRFPRGFPGNSLKQTGGPKKTEFKIPKDAPEEIKELYKTYNKLEKLNDPFEKLGIDYIDPSKSDIKKAYVKLVRQFHPDKCIQISKKSEFKKFEELEGSLCSEIFKIIQSAYESLSF